jgi:nucleoside-diphosphate-sugar epimerase
MAHEKILVTGAAGFIGSDLCSALVSSGNMVWGVDNISQSTFPPWTLDATLNEVDFDQPFRSRLHDGDLVRCDRLAPAPASTVFNYEPGKPYEATGVVNANFSVPLGKGVAEETYVFPT